ncbi:HAD-IA family hydrolase [Cellulomonas sp. JZ18]|uniref:HAD-IA family hydrolase n=1 Tax=Cellulomonas sp. JZ18 TaxID=2654191 RepID=UPI0012D3795C|nr:HAD-IA family hydrolase [Cellulomonas sp. JZ18]QGQ18281.1 HAD-IA family hydrolase [Cellulomonas sp. JZ18]
MATTDGPAPGGARRGARVVLLDVDGVLRHWHDAPVAAVERRAGLAPGTLVATAHALPEYELGVRGRVTFDDWCRATARALAPRIGADAADAVVADWRRYRGDVDGRMVDLVREVAARVPVALLSNAHDCLRADLAGHGVDHLFAHVVCSAEVGVAKPDPAIYAVAAEAVGERPEDCAFVDDRPENVDAARAVGMRAHLFRDVGTCAAFLRAAVASGGDARGG